MAALTSSIKGCWGRYGSVAERVTLRTVALLIRARVKVGEAVAELLGKH